MRRVSVTLSSPKILNGKRPNKDPRSLMVLMLTYRKGQPLCVNSFVKFKGMALTGIYLIQVVPRNVAVTVRLLEKFRFQTRSYWFFENQPCCCSQKVYCVLLIFKYIGRIRLGTVALKQRLVRVNFPCIRYFVKLSRSAPPVEMGPPNIATLIYVHLKFPVTTRPHRVFLQKRIMLGPAGNLPKLD